MEHLHQKAPTREEDLKDLLLLDFAVTISDLWFQNLGQ